MESIAKCVGKLFRDLEHTAGIDRRERDQRIASADGKMAQAKNKHDSFMDEVRRRNQL